MITLALEFSSEQRSVALARDGAILAAASETGGRGTKAFALIEKVLVAANVRREDVETIAVGLGPGSYTGIRAAIAVAQGWELAPGIKLLGISSVAAIAAQAAAAGCSGRINIVVDAQRGEFYLAMWELSGTLPTEVVALKIVTAAEIISLQNAGELCVGPEMEQKIFPTASGIIQLAGSRTDHVAGEKLEPIYLRETTFVKTPPTRFSGV